jgi:hypothetical protein
MKESFAALVRRELREHGVPEDDVGLVTRRITRAALEVTLRAWIEDNRRLGLDITLGGKTWTLGADGVYRPEVPRS